LGRNIQMFEEIKKKYVRMALETNHYASTAKSAGVSRETLRQWIKKYETEVMDQMEADGDPSLSITTAPSEETYKKMYEKAIQLLGEKELEVALLRDTLKKSDHH
jgi:transposase